MATERKRSSSTIPPFGTSRCINIRGIRGQARPRSAASGMCSTCRGLAGCRAPSTCATSSPASLYRRPDGALEQDISPARVREILQAGEGELWVDIDSTNMHQLALLEKVFEFHPLSIEDTLSPGTRVKFEEYNRYVFVVMAVIRFDEGTPEPYDLATSNLYFFLGKNFLVTVHALPQQSCELVRERLIRNPELLARGVEMAMHNIIDQSVDAYFPMVEELNTMVDGLEERLFERFNPGLIHEIFKAKRSAFSLRRHVGPLREVLNILTNRPCGFIRA